MTTLVRQRLADDLHVWATTLFDEVAALAYARSYQTFTWHLRDRQLQSHCEPCAARCRRAAIEERWATTLRIFNGPSVLIVDELGYLPMSGPR